MAFKNLKQFSHFDFLGFIKDKELTVVSCQPWKDFDTKAVLGTRVETVITKDGTQYPSKDGATVTNLYEKLTIKVPKALSLAPGTVVTIIDGEATIYGEYRNQISVKAADVVAVQSHQGGSKA